MKFSPSHDGAAATVTVATAENCDTDTAALVPQVFFRNYRGTYDPESGALAASILFSRHCGSVADFSEARIGIDAARAVRAIVPDVEEVMQIDGNKREIGQGVAAVVVGEAERVFSGAMPRGAVGRSTRVMTWSGDFLAHGARVSSDFVGGEIFTNALMVAPSTRISIALALLIGGRNLRDIYVPKPANDEEEDFARIAGALEHVAIKVRAI